MTPNQRTVIGAALTAVVLGLALSCSSHAQTAPVPNPCNVPEPLPKAYADWQAKPRTINCAPAPLGNGTPATFRFNKAGVHGWSWCPKTDGTWALQMAAVEWDEALRMQLTHDAQAIARASDPKDALQRIMDKNESTVTMADALVTPVWCPNLKEVFASQPGSVTPTVWLVAPATVGTRPLYSIVNGALVLATGRATVGQPCDCTTPFVKTTSTYCVPAGQTTLVTLCRKQ